VFGLYAPRNGRAGGGGNRAGAPGGAGAGAASTPPAAPATPPVVKTPLELAKDALAYDKSDFIFNGDMEGGLERATGTSPIASFTEFVSALGEAGALVKSPYPHFAHPLAVKTPKIAEDPVKAIDNISRQLNVGVSAIVFVGVESADEVKQGLAAMRFKAQGGTRPDTVGTAPALWGMTEAQYRKKADVWPLNPDGELMNWTIVESKEGLKHVREIAAVKGISVLFPGAGTLRGVFTTTKMDADGKPVLDANGRPAREFDEKGWEGALQQVLDACKEFHVPCGFPATENDIEMRMKQGFDFFVINWGDPGFRTVELGRKIAGR
jgi:hypothetical protein